MTQTCVLIPTSLVEALTKVDEMIQLVGLFIELCI